MLNGEIYEVCPRSIYQDHAIEQFLVELYFECKNAKHFPAPGSLMEQTHFVYDYFRFLDSKVGTHWERERAKREYEHNELMKKMKGTTKGVKK